MVTVGGHICISNRYQTRRVNNPKNVVDVIYVDDPLGLFASMVFGVGTPLFAILFGEAMDCFAIPDYDEALQKARDVVQQNFSP